MQNSELGKKDIVERTFKFGVRIVKMVSGLPKTPSGFALGGQVVRSGTSVGANIEEAQSAVSKADFVNKMNIALKEARETSYWLRVLAEAKLLSTEFTRDILSENEELVRILVTIIKNTKRNN